MNEEFGIHLIIDFIVDDSMVDKLSSVEFAYDQIVKITDKTDMTLLSVPICVKFPFRVLDVKKFVNEFNIVDKMLEEKLTKKFTINDGEKYGITSVGILAESHISIHTWPEFKLVNLDIFSCREFNYKDILSYLVDNWNIIYKNVVILKRPRHLDNNIELI